MACETGSNLHKLRPLKFRKSLHARLQGNHCKRLTVLSTAQQQNADSPDQDGCWLSSGHKAEATHCASRVQYLLLWLQPQSPMSPSIMHSLGPIITFHGLIQFQTL